MDDMHQDHGRGALLEALPLKVTLLVAFLEEACKEAVHREVAWREKPHMEVLKALIGQGWQCWVAMHLEAMYLGVTWP